jgi:hypothetical protein
MTTAGAHTVGAADGGAGIPGTGWSIAHGDLRVSHFLGLHAMQALPLVVLALGRKRFAESTRVRLTLIAGGSYAALFSILLWQALRGQSVLAPDMLTLATLAVWATITATAARMSVGRGALIHDVVTV